MEIYRSPEEEPIETQIFMRYGETAELAENAIQAYHDRLLLGLTPDEALAYVHFRFNPNASVTDDSDVSPDQSPGRLSS